MTERIVIAPASAADYQQILELNTAAVPNVNLIGEETLAHLHEQAFTLMVARDSAEPRKLAGFLLALDETASYESVNYRFFKANYAEFVYVDRIVTSADYRRLGIGSRFYDNLFTLAAERPVTCEVNLEPPNPGSMKFHRGLGFEPVAEQDTEGGTKRVALLARRP